MITSRMHIRSALLAGCILTGCVSPPGAQVEGVTALPVAPSFVLENLSQDTIGVYLVDGTEEILLGRLAPLQIERVSLPEHVFTSRAAMITLAVVKHPPMTPRPSQENGAVVSDPLRSASLNGRTLAFSGDRLFRPYR